MCRTVSNTHSFNRILILSLCVSLGDVVFLHEQSEGQPLSFDRTHVIQYKASENEARSMIPHVCVAHRNICRTDFRSRSRKEAES